MTLTQISDRSLLNLTAWDVPFRLRDFWRQFPIVLSVDKNRLVLRLATARKAFAAARGITRTMEFVTRQGKS